MPEETVLEVLPPPTLEELHTFLLDLREATYISALTTAQMIDAWLLKYPLPVPPPPEEEPAAA